jgi:hypothetical protein
MDLVRGYSVGMEGESLVIRAGKSCYFIFQLCLQIRMLKKGKTFVHSAGFSDGKNSTIVAGWPGSGKTACAYKVTEHFNWKTLGDELVVVDKSGLVTPQLKPFYIYNYHTVVYPPLDCLKKTPKKGSKERARHINCWSRSLKNLLAIAPPLQEFLRGKNPYINRVLPVNIFGPEGLGTLTPLKNILWIERTKSDLTFHTDIGQLPSRLMGSMLNEFGDREISMLNLLVGQGIISLEKTYKIWIEILIFVCANAKGIIVEVPDDTAIEDLPGYIINALEQKHLDVLV